MKNLLILSSILIASVLIDSVLSSSELLAINDGNVQGDCICYYDDVPSFANCEQQTRHLECDIVYCDPTKECAAEN
ncbi:MAG: hypothetical protein WBB45_07145 [Cyclobacteriaceae bacterium]